MRNLMIGLLCAATVGFMTVSLSASQTEQDSKPAAAQKKGKDGQKKGQGANRRSRDPQQMAARMIQQFDKNGDKALNAQELAAALTAMRAQRGPDGRPGAGKGRPGKGGDAKGKGKGRPGDGKGKGGDGKGKGGDGN